jgi:iron(III) transport system ATP-binding protein
MSVAGSGAVLEVTDLVKDYPLAKGWHRALEGVSFDVQEGHFYSLLGPSGCGKTTTLRCVAGLERPGEGSIVIGGETVATRDKALAPEKRDIGMVFQSYAIWPHMTVFENTAFPLQVGKAKLSRQAIAARVDEALAIVGLELYRDRPATQLSGGQQQRLALARALIRRPRLLLLDEPLSNLDARLRDRMRAEIRDLQRRLGITTLYVTHDQVEALSMSNRIAVMDGGHIVQEGTPKEIYRNPVSRFVAAFVGQANFLTGTVDAAAGEGRMRIATGGGFVEAACPTGIGIGDEVTVSVRPEDVRLATAGQSGANRLAGTVEQVLFLGEAIDVRVTLGGETLVARTHAAFEPGRGDAIAVELPVERVTVIHDEHGVVSGAAHHTPANGEHHTHPAPEAAAS